MPNLKKSFLMGTAAAGAALCTSAFFSILAVQAACTNPSTIPTGFAAPCPVFSLSSTSVTQAQTLTLSATPQPGTDYIYSTAYVSNGTAWNPYTLQGNNAYPSYSSALASLTLSSAQLSSLSLGTHYAVVWDWLWDATANCYKGPGLNQCNTGAWRVQSFSLTSSATPTPTPTPSPYTYSQSSYYVYSQASYYAYSQSAYYSYSQASYYVYSQSAYTGGNTITAASCSRTDVQAAVNSAARGDTVRVPAGSCSWSSPLNITTGITLTGAGAGSTIITSSGGITLITANPDATAIANSENIKITGFTFDGANSSGILIQLEGANGISGTKPYRYYIIGDNTFRNANPASAIGGTTGACIQSFPDSHGQLRGVIYHNTFDRCNILLRVFSEDSTSEWSNTAFNQLAYGTSDSLYFEDNTIQFSSSYNGADPGWIETGQGGRLVARYNNYNFANAATPQEIWDIHGFQNWNGTANSGQTSTMEIEYYGNTLSNAGQYRWVNHRGSWALVFNNILTGSGGNVINLYGVSSPGRCTSDIYPPPTNYNPLVNNSYFFNNTKNGTIVPATLSVASCGTAENANWWNYNAACTTSSCTAGIGRGTTAPTGTCTTGVAYWVASTATPTASSSVIQNSALYKCTSTNTWTRYFTPYAYPHPLRSM